MAARRTPARRVHRARIAADLIDKVFKAEGWTKVYPEASTRTGRMVALYDISRTRDGWYVATPKKDSK